MMGPDGDVRGSSWHNDSFVIIESLFCGVGFSVGLKLPLREERRHPGEPDWGSPGMLRLRLRLRMTCTAFGSCVFVFVHPRVIDPVRISNSFKHFDL